MAWLKRGAGRPPRLDIALAALAVLASLAPLVRDFLSLDDLMVRGRAMLGRDFVNAWAGASFALQGKAAELYSADYVPIVRELLGRPVGTHNFSYPPTLLLFIWPLAFLPYLPALVAWVVGTLAAFLAAARPYAAKAGLPLWVAALLPACLVNLWAGHHGFVLAALWLAAFAALPGRPLVAGLLIALLTLKPHMGVLIPLVLVLRGEWRAIGAAAAGAILLALLSLALFGWAAWANYFDWTAKLQAGFLIRERSFFLYLMPTPWVGFWLASKAALFAAAAHCLVAAAAIFIVVRAARSAMPWPELGLITATATFLVLPYAFNYDMAAVGLAAAMLLFGRSEALGWLGRALALTAFAAPILVFPANWLALPLLPLALFGFLLIQLRAYQGLERKSPEAAPRGPSVSAVAEA